MSELLKSIDQIPNPCFVIDEELFVKNMLTLKKVEDVSGCEILCALKGFSMWEMFSKMTNYISGGTASSLNEAKLINEKMGQKAHSCFVTYLEEEFSEVQEISSHLSFNSISQFNRFKKKLDGSIKYAFRINPQFSSVSFDKYNPCAEGSRFGVTEQDLPKTLPKQISGLHFHTLCESSAKDLEDLLKEIEAKFGHLLKQASWVNLGGGHHITKPGYDTELLCEIIKGFREKYNIDVYLEPGEAIGLNTGYLVSKIEDVVKNGYETTAILNVSFAAHMPDCLEMPYKPNIITELNEGVEITLGGNTCMSGDYVRGFKFNATPLIGDIIVFKDMMHYTFVKTSFFNGVKHPSLGLWNDQSGFKLLKEFSYLDFKYRLS